MCQGAKVTQGLLPHDAAHVTTMFIKCLSIRIFLNTCFLWPHTYAIFIVFTWPCHRYSGNSIAWYNWNNATPNLIYIISECLSAALEIYCFRNILIKPSVFHQSCCSPPKKKRTKKSSILSHFVQTFKGSSFHL